MTKHGMTNADHCHQANFARSRLFASGFNLLLRHRSAKAKTGNSHGNSVGLMTAANPNANPAKNTFNALIVLCLPTSDLRPPTLVAIPHHPQIAKHATGNCANSPRLAYSTTVGNVAHITKVNTFAALDQRCGKIRQIAKSVSKTNTGVNKFMPKTPNALYGNDKSAGKPKKPTGANILFAGKYTKLRG